MRSSTIAASCWLATFVFLTGLSATAFAEDIEADEKDTEEVSGEEVEGGEDEEFDARGTVQVDPLTAALGYWHIQVEHRLGDKLADEGEELQRARRHARAVGALLHRARVEAAW